MGESGVGKSSILLRFTDDIFVPNMPGTIGLDFKVKNIILNGNNFRLAIWVI
jgi:GTPase SAR1 family protein